MTFCPLIEVEGLAYVLNGAMMHDALEGPVVDEEDQVLFGEVLDNLDVPPVDVQLVLEGVDDLVSPGVMAVAVQPANCRLVDRSVTLALDGSRR